MKKNRIIIFDTTLRDGEQCPGASMNLREKLEIARQLARLKVDVIEAGFPVISDGDFASVQTIAREVKGPVICGLARCTAQDIDAAGAAVKPAGPDPMITTSLTLRFICSTLIVNSGGRLHIPGHPTHRPRAGWLRR